MDQISGSRSPKTPVPTTPAETAPAVPKTPARVKPRIPKTPIKVEPQIPKTPAEAQPTVKAIPVDLSSKQVIVKKPQENSKYPPKSSIPIEWETELPREIGSTADSLYFDIDIYGPGGATQIYNIAKREHWRSYHISGNRYRTTWYWEPTEGNQAIRTGYHKIKITPRYAAGNIGGMPGFSGKIHLSRGVVRATHKLSPEIRNRFSRKTEFYTVSAEPGIWEVLPQYENKPGTARVGYNNHYEEIAAEYKYHGFVFRSQITFPTLKSWPGRLLLKAELHLTVKYHLGNKAGTPRNSTCAGALYYLTSPWEGKCIDTPGYVIAAIPDQPTLTLDITQYAQNWYTGSEPNHGLIIGSVREDFAHIKRSCVTWYEAELIVEYLIENKY